MKVVKTTNVAGFNPRPHFHSKYYDLVYRAYVQALEERTQRKLHENKLTDCQLDRFRRSVPFGTVYKRLNGKPTLVVFGGKEELPATGNRRIFLDHTHTAVALLGGTVVQGQGQGSMEDAARKHHDAIKRIQSLPYKCYFAPRIAGVPLDIEEEHMHRYGMTGYVTRAIDVYDMRTKGLQLLGCPMVILALRGGNGTDEEVVNTYNELHLAGRLITPFERVRPALMMADGDDRFWESKHPFREKMIHGTESRLERKRREFENFRDHHVNYDVDPIAAARTVFDRFCAVSLTIYGARLDDVFIADNGVHPFEVARNLLEQTSQSMPRLHVAAG